MTTANSQAVSHPEYYDGLEVDTRTRTGGGWNADDVAKFRMVHQVQNPTDLPEVHDQDLPQVSPYQAHDNSLPEAVYPQAAGVPGTAHNASSPSPPDPNDLPEVASENASDNKRAGTICGLRRKVFWIILAVALVVVISAAIGGGVGGALASRAGSAPSGIPSDGPGVDGGGVGGGGDSNSTTANEILPSSSIGALNFTDQYGFENHLVFYQLRSKVLMQSSWNSSTRTWSSAVANRDSDVKEGTPISNSLFWHGQSSRDIRIYYLNDKNQVMGQINLNPIYTQSWDASGVSGLFTAGESSQLLSNGQYTPDSYLSNVVLYQDSGSTLRVLRRTGGSADWSATGISTDFGKPADGTGLAFIPIYTTDSTKTMKLFYASDSGSLTALTLRNDNDWTNDTLPMTVEKNATIAAFSLGYDNKDLTVHVLATQSGKAPMLMAYSGGVWNNEGEIESMSGEDTPIKIAANLAGRVYGIVERNGGEVQIVEWEWTGGATYNKIGVVDVVA